MCLGLNDQVFRVYGREGVYGWIGKRIDVLWLPLINQLT